MSAPEADEALLESLDRHFIAGCPSLSTSQLREHKARGTCTECESRAKAAGSKAEQAAEPCDVLLGAEGRPGAMLTVTRARDPR